MGAGEFHTVRGYQLLNQNKSRLTPAMEDYLEMICRNIGREGYVRINELAEMLHVKSSSATKMVQKLGELGFLKYRKYGIIAMTDDGRALGEYLLRRHNVIAEFLQTLGCARENLLEETELIEHSVGSDTVANMETLVRFFKTYPELGRSWEKYRANSAPRMK
jgi:DtxR family Mn-dependent transcriptional regulator